MSLFNIFERAKTNVFFKNVATLASGTIISQLVLIAVTPLLSRMYSVDSFGLLQLFTSYMVISAVASTGRYELAMGLPEKETDARKIFQLIVFFGFFVSLFYLSLIFIMKEGFNLESKFEILRYWWIYLAPIYIFFIAIYSGLNYWLQRQKKYKKITIANAIQVLLSAIFGLLFGFLKFESGLILALILAVFLASIYLLFDYIKENSLYSLPQMYAQGKKYISFPKHMLLSDVSLAASQQLTPILFANLYSITIVGFYSMANRMLRLPNLVITSSIANVFRNDAIDEIRRIGNCKDLYMSTFKKLAIMSIPIYTIVFFAAPFLFTFVFGEEWLEAGYYARIICVFLLIEFIATPLNTMFYIKERQKLLMKLQVLNAILGGVFIYIGAVYFDSARISLILFSVNAILFNILLLYFSHKISSSEL